MTLITLLAATGYTGRLIAQELARQGARFQIAGRSREKLAALARALQRADLPMHVVDVTRVETLAPALADARVVINCAGPFTELGLPVVRAVIERGLHYLDTTGEQAFIKEACERYHEPALGAGCALIPACAFDFAVADAGAALAALGLNECEEISIYYAFEGGFATSRGTKKSVLHAITSANYFYRDGRYVEISAAGEQRTIEFPKIGARVCLAVGGGEVISVPRHVRTRAVSTFMSLGQSRLAVKAGAAMLGAVMKTPLRGLIFNRIDAQAAGPDEAERARTMFTIICEARAGERRQRVIITGRDPYGLSAIIVAETATRLVAADKDVAGATSAARAFGAEMIERVTAPHSVDWRRE